MADESNRDAIPNRWQKKVRLTIFVNPETVKALDGFKIIYGSTPGQIMDSMIHTLRTARAEKFQWCITGKRCQFNQPFPEQELI